MIRLYENGRKTKSGRPRCGWVTSAFTTGRLSKVKFWRLVRTKLQKQAPRWRNAGQIIQHFEIIDGNTEPKTN
jgi:hypothetical protein